MDLDLRGKSVLVLAGTRGIGFAIAQRLAAEGAGVTVCGKSQTSVDAAIAQSLFAVRGDLSRPTDIERVVEAAVDRTGPIDVLVINSGGPPAGEFETLPEESWDEAIALLLKPALQATRLVLPQMRSKRWGRIIIVSSYGVRQPIQGLTLSNTIRLAVLGWAKTLSQQVAADNILVNTICPGWTKTDRVSALLEDERSAFKEAEICAQIPLRRMAEPQEIAGMAAFLASSWASYITGTTLCVDGGIVRGY